MLVKYSISLMIMFRFVHDFINPPRPHRCLKEFTKYSNWDFEAGRYIILSPNLCFVMCSADAWLRDQEVIYFQSRGIQCAARRSFPSSWALQGLSYSQSECPGHGWASCLHQAFLLHGCIWGHSSGNHHRLCDSSRPGCQQQRCQVIH